MEQIKKLRVKVYVDGFNFYYGMKSKNWKKYYWLDIVKYFELSLKDNQELISVNYYSATPLKAKDKADKQDLWFSANNESQKFRLILGRYMKKNMTCFGCGCAIQTFEEKESDVHLGVDIISDAYENSFDIAIIVSADSDMIPVVNKLKELDKQFFIYFPPGRHSSNLEACCRSRPTQMDRYEKRFKQSQFPDTITLPSGVSLTKPQDWV